MPSTAAFGFLLLPPECATEGQFIRVMRVPSGDSACRAIMGVAHPRTRHLRERSLRRYFDMFCPFRRGCRLIDSRLAWSRRGDAPAVHICFIRAALLEPLQRLDGVNRSARCLRRGGERRLRICLGLSMPPSALVGLSRLSLRLPGTLVGLSRLSLRLPGTGVRISRLILSCRSSCFLGLELARELVVSLRINPFISR
jgi:hypothetical protein